MRATALVLAALLTAASARAASDFVRAIDKAESRKEPAERAEYFDRALKLWQPEDGQELLAHCRLRRGEARYELYDFKQAEPDLDKAVELDPGSARAFYLRGRIKLRSGRADAALVDLKEYSVLKDEDVDGWLAVGEAQAKLGRFDDAQAAYKRAADLDPADHRPALGQARLWMARKDWPRALERLDAADQLAKHRSPEVFQERAVCAVAAGKPEQALDDYGRALPLFDRRLDDLRRSRAHPVAVQELREKAAHAYYGRGRLLEFDERLADAREDYRQACDLGHEEACKRLDGLKPEGEASRPAAARRPKDAQAERPKPAKRRRTRAPESDPGDRIYAN